MSNMGQKFRYVNEKIHRHAKGQSCTNCGVQDDTIVCAHSNQEKHGHGRGIKSHSCFVAFLCHRCHAWLDQGIGMDPANLWRDDEKTLMFNDAMHRTWLILVKDRVLQ